MVGCHGAKNAGTGGALRVNFAEAAKSPDARTLPANHEVFDPGTEPAVPSRPTAGTRKQAATAPVATPQALRIRPCDIAIFPCPFDGVAQNTFGSAPDQNALLLSLRTTPTNDCSNPMFTVFGLTKSTISSGQHVEFDAFPVDSLTAPVTNAGQPLIASPVSFFLAAVPGTGYKLYRLTNSGGSGAIISHQTISEPFSKPSRSLNQPPPDRTNDPSDHTITSFP